MTVAKNEKKILTFSSRGKGDATRRVSFKTPCLKWVTVEGQKHRNESSTYGTDPEYEPYIMFNIQTLLQMPAPPVTSSVCPETYDASGDAKLEGELRDVVDNSAGRGYVQEHGSRSIIRRSTPPQRDKWVCLGIGFGICRAWRARNAQCDLLPVYLNRCASLLRCSQPISDRNQSLDSQAQECNMRSVPGVDQPECDCIGADTVWAPLLRNGFCKTCHSSLGGCVVRLSDISVQTGGRGNIDDGPVFACIRLTTLCDK